MNEAGTGHQVGQTANCWMMRRRRTRNTYVGVGRFSSDIMRVQSFMKIYFGQFQKLFWEDRLTYTHTHKRYHKPTCLLKWRKSRPKTILLSDKC
jgi:glycosyltransferase involved in cell wall biosynthesis